jgi:hypothetical protein
MFDKAKIQTSLSGLVGWQQPANPDYDIVSSANLLSRSSRYVNENPFCKVELLKDNYDYAGVSDNDFNTFLANIINQAITTVCDNVFNATDYIDRGLVYQNANNKINAEILPSGFVGYEICSEKTNVAFKITRVLCDFANTGTFTLLLFNSQKKTPIQTKLITITTDNQEVVLDWVCNNTLGYSGEWYVGYIAGALQPYERNYSMANDITTYENCEVESMYVNGVNTNILWNLEQIEYDARCWGLNFDITVYEDFTDLIVNNESLFAKAIQMQTQIKCIENIKSSIRSNLNERIARDLIVEIEGIEIENGINKVGLKALFFGEISKLKNEIEKLRNGYKKLGLQINTLC